MILSSTYLGPISWYAHRVQREIGLVDAHEHYIKQSYRNRTAIFGPHGPQDLNIPVAHPGKQPMSEIQLSFRENWKSQHVRALETAYKNAPFYEAVAGELREIYHQPIQHLFEFNQALDYVISSWLNIAPLSENETFEPYSEQDLRLLIHPKKKEHTTIVFPKYRQVFEGKYGFQTDLSILDLIFNEGPLAYSYLTELKLP